jgi:hypothetical protein
LCLPNLTFHHILTSRYTSYRTFQSLVNATSTSLDAPHQDAPAVVPGATGQLAARRLKRVRQRMGAYRHDLLVALRVINKVEREMVQAEWEGWLAGEAARCEMAREMLLPQNKGQGQSSEGEHAAVEDDAKHGDGDGAKGQRGAALKKWFAEYCASCAEEQRAVHERMRISF